MYENGKMRLVEIILRMVGGIRRMMERVSLRYIANMFIIVAMYPHYNNNI
jgi:hypothetical protein